MPLHGDCLLVVRINGMALAFAKENKTVFFEVADEIPPFDRHLDLSGNMLQQPAAHGNFLFLVAIGQYHLMKSVLEHRPTFFEGFSLCHDLRPLDKLAHIACFDLGVLGCIGGEHAFYPL